MAAPLIPCGISLGGYLQPSATGRHNYAFLQHREAARDFHPALSVLSARLFSCLWLALLTHLLLGIAVFALSFFFARKALPGSGREKLLAFLLPFILWPFLTPFLNPVPHAYHNRLVSDETARGLVQYTSLANSSSVSVGGAVLVPSTVPVRTPGSTAIRFSKTVQAEVRVQLSQEGDYSLLSALYEASWY